MAPANLPTEFKECCLKSAEYPLNLANTMPNTYPSVLRGLSKQFKDRSTQLFVDSEDDVEVPWRDLGTDSGQSLKKKDIHNSEKLDEMMGLTIDTSSPGGVVVSSNQQDPQCRFIYLFGDTTLSVLNITRPMLAKILTYHQVMPAYLDFIMAFGQQDEPKDLRFSGFRKQLSLAASAHLPEIAALGRSGRQYQLCYNLKSISIVEDGRFSMIRQEAIHHQFDAITGKTLWIVTAGRRDLQERYKELTGKDAKPQDKAFGSPIECLQSSLAAHSMFCSWSTENWRWYIKSLENDLEEATRMTVHGPRGEYHQMYKPGDLQALQRHEDVVHEAIAALEANKSIMSSLVKFYAGLKDNKDFPLKSQSGECIDIFTDYIEDIINDIELQISRAHTLIKITHGRKELVTQHFQSQSTENMEKMNRNMERETILVRIVTIVTLIYLPATFVSKTFFSTDVIKYQNEQSDAGSFSHTAMIRWLQVALPLTVLTLLLSWMWNRWAKRRLQCEDETPQLFIWPFKRRKTAAILPQYNEKPGAPPNQP